MGCCFAGELQSEPAAENDDEASLKSGEEIKCQSPDGKFAMLLSDDSDGYKVQLVEVSSRQPVVELAANVAYPPVKKCKLLWSPDSKRVAFFEANRRGGDTTVYFRNESGFEKKPLPEWPGCGETAKKDKDKTYKGLESNIAPKEWLKSGALVVVEVQGWETVSKELRSCTQTVTIAFDARHKASIQSVRREKLKRH